MKRRNFLKAACVAVAAILDQCRMAKVVADEPSRLTGIISSNGVSVGPMPENGHPGHRLLAEAANQSNVPGHYTTFEMDDYVILKRKGDGVVTKLRKHAAEQADQCDYPMKRLIQWRQLVCCVAQEIRMDVMLWKPQALNES